jgi:putative two-component system protein, hydrogenase maturation factor HypX/HoxX
MTASRIQRVLLLSNAFGGATMAAYCWLRDRGIQTAFQPAGSAAAMIAADLRYGPDLLFAPMLTARVPGELLGRVVINHPGRIGDRGASSIDWGRYRREPFGGTTLLLAAEGWDTGDVMYTATYPYPDEPATKSWIYSHLNRTAMLRGLEQLTAEWTPAARPLDYEHCDVLGTWNDPMRPGDSTLDWTMAAEEIVWRAAARDGAPGVLTDLLGRAVHLYDVHLAGPTRAAEGEVVGWIADAAIRVAAGPRGANGLRESVWIGYVKPASTADGQPTFKQPGAWWLRDVVGHPLQQAADPHPYPGYRPVTTQQRGSVAIITASAYNGAWSTRFCHRVAATVDAAAGRREIDQIILRGGGGDPFGNGIHLNHIYGASRRGGRRGARATGLRREAEANIRAINEVALALFRARRGGRSVIVLLDGDAGAGGAFLSLCADVVVAVPGRTFNYHYQGMGGLTGSEFHTLTLPFRVMDEAARSRLLTECLPLSAYQAHRLGLVDYLAPQGIVGRDLTAWTLEFAARHRQLVAQDDLRHWRPLPSEEDLVATQARELRTIDRDFASPGFQAALQGFVLKRRGAPPTAATEYRAAYDGTARPDATPAPDPVAATGGGP